MCTGDGENRVCIEFTANGWIATKGEGKNAVKITDSKEITALMNSDDPADQARAAYLMYLITHPEIQGDHNQIGECLADGYLYWADIEGKNTPVWIYISELFESDKGQSATVSLTQWEMGNGVFIDTIKLVVYQSAFQSVAHLFHVIGHEGVHIY